MTDRVTPAKRMAMISRTIDHKAMDPATLLVNESIMRAGNIALRQCYALVCPKVVGRYSRRAFRQELFDAMKKASVVVRGITLEEESVKLIRAVREIESAMIQGFVKLVYKLVMKVSSKDHRTYLDPEDFVAYGYQGLLEAVYNYLKEITTATGEHKIIRFKTYAYKAISRYINTALNRKKTNYPWTAQMRKLYERYEKAKKSLNRAANFQEIADFLGFTDEEQKTLAAALIDFKNEDAFRSPKDNSEEWVGFDYTALAEENVNYRKKSEVLEADERSSMSEIWVSYLEAEIMYHHLSDQHGWKDKLAKKYGIKRQAPYETLRRLKSRLEHRHIVKDFIAALKSGNEPQVENFVGPEPQGNKEKQALWRKLFDELANIQSAWEVEYD